MPRGNPQNLVSIGDRTKEEQQKITSKGGRMSGVKRRKIRDAAEIMRTLIHTPLDETERQFLKKYMAHSDIPECDQDQLMFMLVTILKLAQKGNVKCAELVLSLVGQMPASKQEITGADGRPLMQQVEAYDFSGIPRETLLEMVREAWREDKGGGKA